ncbi:CCA tRNA nucleotidyltransferase [bacterium]|nr:CCA tRNA nucleotidyltransferase [bacterium]MBU1994513.1 CCA tRNA nucleotidyltransferase [bacterium]
MIDYPNKLNIIFDKLNKYGAKSILIGGYVRDFLLQKNSKQKNFSRMPFLSKDIDVEVYNISSFHTLENILSEFGSVNSVGKNFGVCKLKMDDLELDFSLPRLDNKISEGHKGFSICIQADLDFYNATKRRDFTINAIGYDIAQKKILDPFHGTWDLKNKILRAVDTLTFIEDPLRVLRAVQFCARFDFTMDEELFSLCKTMLDNNMLDELPKERIFEEIKKLLLKSKKPSIGFELLKKLDALKYFPELKAIIGVKQNTMYHPEGDVWTHTMLTIDEMANLLTNNDKTNIVLMLAALCHDFGKAISTTQNGDAIKSISHENSGLVPAQNFIIRISDDKDILKRVLPLVKYHLMIPQLYHQNSNNAALLRLSTKVNIEELLLLSRADFLARNTTESKSRIYKAGDEIQSRVKELNILNKKMKPLLQGRDILACGILPSKEFSKILNTAYEAQINEVFHSDDGAKKWLKNYLKLHNFIP